MTCKIKSLNYSSCLVTGGAGFIGSHICEEALRQEKHVVCLDNLVAGKMENIESFMKNPNFQFVQEDITSINKILPYFKDVEVVFHNAASKATVCREDPKKDLEVNAWGSWCVLECSRLSNVKKVIMASTGSVYGEAQYSPQDEKHPFKPLSFYGVSKLAGERYVEVFREYYDLNCSVIRHYHVYGPKQESADWGGVIPIFIRRACEGLPLIIYGDGSQVRSFTFVKDNVNANFILANSEESNGEEYNCASGIKVSILELAKMILNLMDRKDLEIQFHPWRPGDIKIFNVDNSKIKSLGVEFETNFEEGLKSTIEWYKEYFVPVLRNKRIKSN